MSRRRGGSMIHRVYEKSGQNKEEGDKNQTGSQGEGWIRPLDSRCAMNSPVLSRGREARQSGDGRSFPWDKEGVKF